ncbi:hypothetical protein BRADI_2g26325v3 [Brachypodium distachyon]|uniref:Uncharacterized protein n=1 Tax=Brachypodium distachyon TaxID=15368 RepID=A0A0Q3J185_BRADI|nr:hypothetical protein BRADI_2g26325v3 [Brachypodium distachyon]
MDHESTNMGGRTSGVPKGRTSGVPKRHILLEFAHRCRVTFPFGRWHKWCGYDLGCESPFEFIGGNSMWRHEPLTMSAT